MFIISRNKGDVNSQELGVLIHHIIIWYLKKQKQNKNPNKKKEIIFFKQTFHKTNIHTHTHRHTHIYIHQ